MLHSVRMVSIFYDEDDTTLADIYDVQVETENVEQAIEKAKVQVEAHAKRHKTPGYVYFVFAEDEAGLLYVLVNGILAILPQDMKSSLPQRFCSDGETFFRIDLRGIASFNVDLSLQPR